MSSFKNRLKTYSFWVSLASAILLLVQSVGKPLGLVLNEEIYMSIVNSVLGVFVVLGIISHPAQTLIENKNENEDDYIVSKKMDDNATIENKSDSANRENNAVVAETDAVKTLEEIQEEILRSGK
ncbi:MAG: hypothetical protein IJ301_01310 [Clostridia bacterium]|nr:hypothetical protein [Clostridia bacterium]